MHFTSIVQKCVEFLFHTIHEDYESAFNALFENKDFRFEFLINVVELTVFNITFFNGYFRDMLNKVVEKYLSNRCSVDYELEMCLALSICNQFLIENSDEHSNKYINFEALLNEQQTENEK